MALNSHTVRAKINPPTVEPQWAHPKTNIRQWPTNENFLSRSSLCLTPYPSWISCMHITKWGFPLFSMRNESKIASLKYRIEPKFQFLWLPILTLSNWITYSLHNTQGTVLKFSHMMWIILNFCLTKKNWMFLTLLSVCSKMFTVCVRRFLKCSRAWRYITPRHDVIW